MTATSKWIPRRRIRVAMGITAGLAVVGVVGAIRSSLALVVLVPAAGAGWATFVMTRIRRQLSPSGGGWEARIHEMVLARLELGPDDELDVLDIGCGDAALLARLLDAAPGVRATGVDLWADDWEYGLEACADNIGSVGAAATLTRMNAAELDFPDGSFDVVVSVMCFHEVRTASKPGTGPAAAVGEALRVTRPGGRFVLVDRFADAASFAPEALDSALAGAVDLRRERLVDVLPVPWPLNSKRALGPVEIVSGRRQASRT